MFSVHVEKVNGDVAVVMSSGGEFQWREKPGGRSPSVVRRVATTVKAAVDAEKVFVLDRGRIYARQVAKEVIRTGALEPWGQMTPRNLPGGQTWYFTPPPDFFLERNIFWYTPTRCYWDYVIIIIYSETIGVFVLFLLSFITDSWTPRNVALVILTPPQSKNSSHAPESGPRQWYVEPLHPDCLHYKLKHGA